ncbi:hypothetical protein [Chitinophaga ginsengisoli]|uniref:Copper chaperone CopZ n=1 Tax=Chitinophaga ginsengisoli TaxID=363837 RepID=A0A2P8G0Y5_9BACT|nr:hypothetical protein [Chitinophaga ginsengisoli]PSL27555.1 hypothetical protein CLV42_10989 [Chitinophaga ginsengisoli]
MVKVFKTDVLYAEEVRVIITDILQRKPDLKVTFDLEDEDKIMRIEGDFFKAEDIFFCLKEQGHSCIELPIDLHLIG